MKKLNTLLASLLIVFSVTSCEKTELPAPETEAGDSMKRGGGGVTAATTYGGRATGIEATVWDFQSAIATSTQTNIADTYFLPATGGSITRSETQGSIPGTLTSGAVNAATTGQNNSLYSEASVSTINITTGGNTISADYLKATASAACGVSPSGSSQITNLVVNGQTITVTGVANQTIYLPNGGLLIINERSTTKKGSSILTVTALHILIPNVSDIRVAAARAEIKC